MARPIIVTGKMDCKIRLENPSETRAADGSLVTTWVTLDDVYAERNPDGGREYFGAGQIQGERGEVYRIRHIEGVNYKTRLTRNSGARVFEIVAIEELGRGVALDLTVKELTTS